MRFTAMLDLDYLRFSNRTKTGTPISRSIYYAIMHISCQRSCLLWHYDSEKHKGFLEYRIRVDKEKLAGLHNLKCFFHWIIVMTRLDEGMKGPKARSV